MDKLAIHFGAGNIGRGFIAPVLEENRFNIIFVDVDKQLVEKLNSSKNYTVSNFSEASSSNFSVSNFSAIQLDNLDELKSALEKADLITTSVGPDHLINVLEKISLVKLEKEVDFIAFENKYRASSSSYKEAKIEIKNLNVIDAVVDKIVPPQLPDSIDVIVEEYGSIILEDKESRPLKTSEVVSYGDYETEFTKKLWMLNGLHLMSAYFGLSKNKEFIHELFEDEECRRFVMTASNHLGEAYKIYRMKILDEGSFTEYVRLPSEGKEHLIDRKYIDQIPIREEIGEYQETILQRFSMAEVKDSLIRVARNPILKFNKSERFQAPLHILLKNEGRVGSFQEVFELLQNFNYDNVEGFGEFKKLFENGIEEFLNGFWDVGSDLEIYLSKLK